MSNENPLDVLLNPRFKVDSVSVEGLQYQCRDIPNITFLDILADALRVSREEYDSYKRELMDEIRGVIRDGGKLEVTDQDLQRWMVGLFPVLIRLVTSSSHWTKKLIKDVVIGAEDNHVEAMSNEDIVAIIDSAIDRIDTDLIAQKLQRVFQKAATVWQKIPGNQQTKQEPEAEKSSEQEEN